jgi:hypothetical protein
MKLQIHGVLKRDIWEAGHWDSSLVGKSTNTNCQDSLSFVLVCLSATHTDLGMDVMLQQLELVLKVFALFSPGSPLIRPRR